MQIQRIILRELALPLKSPFKTSFGTIHDRHVILVEMIDQDGYRGFGESSPISPPSYTEESVGTAWHVLQEYLCPLALHSSWDHPQDLSVVLRNIRRNYAAKSGLEGAVWDLFARRRDMSLAHVVYELSGARQTGTQQPSRAIPSGIALGIPADIPTLITLVEDALMKGYRRIKIKVQPGWDVEPMRALRRHVGNFPLSVDANASYTLNDIDHVKSWDEFSLDMIEQPLGWDDLLDHSRLQTQLETPLCLDESITSVDSARHAIELGSCRIMNIKIGRVGGLTQAVQIHDLCQSHGIPVWCGGLLETGVGRVHSLALASLPNFTLPADLSPSARYFTQDIVSPEIAFHRPGYIPVPTGPGIGVTLCTETIKAHTVKIKEFSRRPTRRSSN